MYFLSCVEIKTIIIIIIIIIIINDFVSGNLVPFCILWCSNFCFIQSRYHRSFCLGMGFFWNWTLSTRLPLKQGDCKPRMHEFYRGGTCPLSPPPPHRTKIFENWALGTPYPAFPGSNAINWYLYFVLFPSRSTKIHDSQVFKTKIHDYFMFCNYDSWFRFNPRRRSMTENLGHQLKISSS